MPQTELENILWKLGQLYSAIEQAGSLAYEIKKQVESLDPRSPTLRAPVHAEQKCPNCQGDGQWKDGHDNVLICRMCMGTGISNRSDGG